VSCPVDINDVYESNYATLDASGKCTDAALGLFFGGND
jgi:hypothetical protein